MKAKCHRSRRVARVLLPLSVVIAAGALILLGVSWRPSGKTGPLGEAEHLRPTQPVVASAPPSPIQFEDVSEQIGVQFRNTSGTTEQKLFPTANGTGCAFVDFDLDGRLDLYFANACELGHGADPGIPNVMLAARGESYVDVSVSSGTAIPGFTQGLATGDFDNDGFPELYLTRFGGNIFLRNNGDGTFQNASAAAGLDDRRWGTSSALLDFDADGNLDLYVANYGKWDLQWHAERICGEGEPPVRVYCSPKALDPETHALYRSLGDGRYEDHAQRLGIARADGRGQGVVTVDVNRDGKTDIYVANDLSPNFLFVGKGDGTWDDKTETSGAAFDSDGRAQAGMGTDAGDVDGDGRPELFVTNFAREYNAIYQNLDGVLFQDRSYRLGLAQGSIAEVGWGCILEDLDSDGWLDVIVANGHVDDNLMQIGRDEPYKQRSKIWRGIGGRFELLQSPAGSYFETDHSSRGLSVGDLDNDGDVDFAVVHKDERPTILRNTSPQENHWCQIALIGVLSNRQAIGARVEARIADRTIHRQVMGGRSYLSGHDYRLTIGLGQVTRIDELTVHWPSGRVSHFQDLPVDQSWIWREPVD